MLTVRQLLVVSGQNGAALNTNALLAEFPARPLSLKSVITAYEKQRLIVFVSLISTRVLLLPHLRTMDDLLEAAKGVNGQVDSSEVLALSSRLHEQGLSLRLLDKGLRRAAIIGTVPALVNVPTIPINDGNLLHVLDVSSGVTQVGGGLGIIGGTLLAIGLATGPIGWVAVTGAVVAGAGGGFLIGTGIFEIWQGDPKPVPRSDSNDNNSTPNDLGSDGSGGETIEIPNAVAFGSPPDDLNVDGVLQQLGDFAVDFSVDMVLSDLPVGFDAGTGAGLPGIPDGNGGDDGDGGGLNPFG
jgi:hypothetical protein